jgi:anti-sigma regulatory factor (Ser/Thr protein kinase)
MVHKTWTVGTLDEVAAARGELSEIVEREAARVGYVGDLLQQFLFRFNMVIEEAWINHVKHGNQMDPAKSVECTLTVATEEAGQNITVESKDQGQGFNPDDLPDPTLPENIEKGSGRGVLLIQECAHRIGANIEYLEGGTRLRVSLTLAPPQTQNIESAA